MSRHVFCKILLGLALLALPAVISGNARGQVMAPETLTPHELWTRAMIASPDHYEMPPVFWSGETTLHEETPAPQMASEGEQQTDTVPDHYRLVYQSFKNGNWDVVVRDQAHQNRVLLDSSRQEIHPRLNLGATKVVFSSNRGGDFELFIINSDGTNLQQLTDNERDDVNPYWSPDGSQIVFESYRDRQAEIYVMDANGARLRRLTDHAAYDGAPVWSPDGQTIAFVSLRDGYYQIYTMGVDGRGLQRLATGMHSLHPAWSIDGSEIAFSADGDHNGWLELWMMSADGSNRRLVHNPGPQQDIWSRSWFKTFGEITYHYITGTQIKFISYGGNWYWSEALLMRFWEHGYNGQVFFEELAWDAGRLAWNPDTVCRDIDPPILAPFTIPQMQRHYLSQSFGPAVDVGVAGIQAVEIQRQTHPGGEWIDHNWTYDHTLTDSPPAGQTYVYRLRAWDHAGNNSPWIHTNPITFYEWSIRSGVTDNRGNPLSDVQVMTDPAAFLQTYQNGAYINYGASFVDAFSAQWQLEGYGELPVRTFSPYSDGEDASIKVSLPPANNLLVNGDFESDGEEGWETDGPAPVIRSHVTAHTGQGMLEFPFEVSSALSISQTVTIPEHISNLTLSFHYMLRLFQQTDDPLFIVQIDDGQRTEALFSAPTETTEWEHVWIDLSSWAGQTVTIGLHRPQSTAYALIWVDDVSLGSTSPDLWLASGGAVAGMPGETVYRSLDYSNRGAVPAPNTVMTLTLPSEVTLLDASVTPSGNNPYTWHLGELPAGATGRIMLSLALSGSAEIGQTVTGQANLSTPYEAYVLNNKTDPSWFVGARSFMPFFMR